MRKMLEHRSITDEERMDGLEGQLKEARTMAEDADRKYDEVTWFCRDEGCRLVSRKNPHGVPVVGRCTHTNPLTLAL